MAKHVVAVVTDIPSGGRFATTVRGRPIVVFNLDGQFFALLDRCPHSGARLSHGLLTGLLQSDAPNCFKYSRLGEIIKCPWHGWEFDIRSGQSYCSPESVKTKAFEVKVQSGSELSKGPFVAETFSVSVENNYVVVAM
ncbi:nitrite reductase/ring-hydroxylating ferredoxin subunit [Bradyrhizobium sp. USDA 4524]|uniref:Rieske (2Fe-2S) protein n=1 Tax=unclassified Bradyrhizobium TaxID=2631580 RepID=UPI00209CBC67|nr:MULTISPECIES: Rieske (2Fe-2S) protein [unclassified Bradyrhizobium]MCP1838529.1 3-phenylpropionate/trans-cinnamate dioxygenase ferredoxin subunit [Bradyrhizobium sp. USDA 4538]MCP1899094.1 3-phenylpropionate/trans-cinnamate dioxygenase ferredoxin subunit [Bradyrhizobium sp. USDA 4537]MCP1986793.1 3-phenylpropionate/trans-cinnamate dioxygenase ferredoxin subunit [Bradyrhizobium sp. USDA 4539]